jgi:hypothetical protein
MEKKITTSDLRLGNWLYESDKSKFPMQVESIGKNWIYLDFEDNEGDVFENTDKEIYPIPFSDRFLSELSKNIIYDGYLMYIGPNNDLEVYVGIEDGVIFLTPSVNDDDFEIGISIRYVHELQNLFYALNGKELEIRREWL